MFYMSVRVCTASNLYVHKSQIVQKIGQKIVLKLDKNCAKNWAKN